MHEDREAQAAAEEAPRLEMTPRGGRITPDMVARLAGHARECFERALAEKLKELEGQPAGYYENVRLAVPGVEVRMTCEEMLTPAQPAPQVEKPK